MKKARCFTRMTVYITNIAQHLNVHCGLFYIYFSVCWKSAAVGTDLQF